MKTLFKERYLPFVLLINFVLFLPSFFVFFTHDDFFHFVIADTDSLKGFLNFFNIKTSPLGHGFYRPLTTQVFYFLGRYVFDLSPFWMHAISYLFFTGIVILVYHLINFVFRDRKAAILGAFLYSTSSIHFMSLYFLGAFQEIGMAFFVLLSVLFYIKSNSIKDWKYLLSLMFFMLALMSKETSVITPFLAVTVRLFLRFRNIKRLEYKKVTDFIRAEISRILPYAGILMVYLYFRIFHYGFIQGDSYVWDFSPRILNSLFWYGLWSFNIPEMLVDFVGPGLHINPNLFKFWSQSIIPIMLLGGLLLFIIALLSIKAIRKNIKLVAFTLTWFFIALLPVLFLPFHKFSFYLTLPLVGIASYISYLLVNFKHKTIIGLFCILWLAGSYMTLKLTEETHWVTRGAQTAKRVDEYFQNNDKHLSKNKNVAFIDTVEDNNLPWKPSQIVKTALSDQNYFSVFHPGKFMVYYGNNNLPEDAYQIEARQFIGY